MKNSLLLLKNILLSLFLKAGATIINKSKAKDRKPSIPCRGWAELLLPFAKTETEEKRRITNVNKVKHVLFEIIFMLEFFMYLVQLDSMIISQ